MKHFLLATNSDKDIGLKQTRKIKEYLTSKGADAYIVPDVYQTGLNWKKIPDNVECAITLGGDGTILQVSRGMHGRDIPVIGVNMGQLGFLAEISITEISFMLDCLLKNEYRIEERMMLVGSVYHGMEKKGEEIALNDIVIGRSGFSRIISFLLYVNGQLLDNYRADGVIIATPTGSTGYNLSAGGPIINPISKLIAITPICAHAMQSKSVILAPEDEISIHIQRVRKTQIEEAFATFDGHKGIMLSHGDVIKVKKASETTKFIKITNHSFYDILKRKL